MKTTLPNRPLSRRDFLRASAGLMGMAALAACAPGAAPAAGGGSAAALRALLANEHCYVLTAKQRLVHV